MAMPTIRADAPPRTSYAAIIIRFMKSPRTLLLALALLGCSRSPAEPDKLAASPSSSPSAISRSRDLDWTVPAGWATERVAERGHHRAKYRVAPVGDDKSPAQVLLSRLDASGKAELDEHLSRWMKGFEGDDVRQGGRREKRQVGSLRIAIVEVEGSYRQPVGPPVGPGGKHAAHLIKKGWRGLAATVLTAERKAWFVEMVGPDETVQSARSGFVGLLESMHE